MDTCAKWLREADETIRGLKDDLAAERERADALQAHEDQTHAVLGAILGTDDSLEQCAKRLLADRDRLRVVIEQAPHGDGCLYGLKATTSTFFHCNCWKRAALEAK